MKTVNHMAAQGDVLFRRVDLLPAGARREFADGPVVVAHSETGHDHVIRTEDVSLYVSHDPLVSYIRVEGPFADVEHARDFHTHETLRLLGRDDGPTFYEVRRQREHVFEVPLPVED